MQGIAKLVGPSLIRITEIGKMKRQKQQWEVGNVFVVKLKDGKFVLGQIVGREARILNSISCAFFDLRVTDRSDVEGIRELPRDKAFSILFVTRDLLDAGVWEVVGNRPISIPKQSFPYEGLREKGFLGAKVIGSGIVNRFLNAFYGLEPWDDWKDPNYLDRLLIFKNKKPLALVFKSTTR
jgi:hypothetical protein